MAKREKPTRNEKGWITAYRGMPVWRSKQLTTSLPKATRLIINLKGCNGSGKSTIPQMMIESEGENAVLITISKEDKLPVATFCPTYNTVILGRYFTACGGCDTLIPSQVQEIIKKLWLKDVHILFEGVIVGDIKSTFYNLMRECREVSPRIVEFCFMGTPFKTCLKRVSLRNGGKPVKVEQIRQKYRNAVSHLKYYLSQGDVGVWVLPTQGSRLAVFNRFLQHYPMLYPPF